MIKAKFNIALIIVIMLGIGLAIGCMSPTGGDIGCGGPGTQGWSGFTSNDDTLYLGSRNGALLALNLEARSQNMMFPGEGEWDYTVEIAAPVNPCGPLLSCGTGGAPKAVLYSTPAASEDLIYIGSYSGKVYSVLSEPVNPRSVEYDQAYPRSETGTIGGIVGNLVLVDDVLFAGSSNGMVYALDAEKLQKIWEFDTGEKVWTTPVISDGVVYIGSFNRKIFALSSEDGSQIWQVDLPTAMGSTPVVYKDKLIFGAFDRNLYAVNKSDGQIKELFQGGNWFWAEPVIKDNIIYAACLDNSIYAINADTGIEQWKQTAESPVISKPVLVGELLISIAKSGQMQFINSNNGVLERTLKIDAEVMAPLYAKDDIIYVHARNGYVYAVDVLEAKVIWKFSTDLGSE